MYLSELYGRIGQILREHGDMKVVQLTTLKRDGVCKECYKEYTSENFNVEETYKTICDGNSFEEVKIEEHFVIYERN